ncbi:hypothetical protein DID75_02185 [Candidatus Marinamargulisbacteria bacterium SCGC AG-410-N11]|nr:hypothetical protein DID75_02185 [Candidatus Marinamargulisbacteria bacterium SCGC AG-410-N11]
MIPIQETLWVPIICIAVILVVVSIIIKRIIKLVLFMAIIVSLLITHNIMIKDNKPLTVDNINIYFKKTISNTFSLITNWVPQASVNDKVINIE